MILLLVAGLLAPLGIDLLAATPASAVGGSCINQRKFVTEAGVNPLTGTNTSYGVRGTMFAYNYPAVWPCTGAIDAGAMNAVYAQFTPTNTAGMEFGIWDNQYGGNQPYASEHFYPAPEDSVFYESVPTNVYYVLSITRDNSVLNNWKAWIKPVGGVAYSPLFAQTGATSFPSGYALSGFKNAGTNPLVAFWQTLQRQDVAFLPSSWTNWTHMVCTPGNTISPSNVRVYRDSQYGWHLEVPPANTTC